MLLQNVIKPSDFKHKEVNILWEKIQVHFNFDFLYQLSRRYSIHIVCGLLYLGHGIEWEDEGCTSTWKGF
jgi:hypothetical protein